MYRITLAVGGSGAPWGRVGIARTGQAALIVDAQMSAKKSSVAKLVPLSEQVRRGAPRVDTSTSQRFVHSPIISLGFPIDFFLPPSALISRLAGMLRVVDIETVQVRMTPSRLVADAQAPRAGVGFVGASRARLALARGASVACVATLRLCGGYSRSKQCEHHDEPNGETTFRHGCSAEAHGDDTVQRCSIIRRAQGLYSVPAK